MKTSPGYPWLSSRPTCPSLTTLHPSSSPLFVSWVLTLLLAVVVCVLTKTTPCQGFSDHLHVGFHPTSFPAYVCHASWRPIWLDLPTSDRCCFVGSWSAVGRCDGKCYVANKHVRALFLGGNSHLEVLSVKHLLGAVARSTDQSLARWNGPVGSPVRLLRQALRAWLRHHLSLGLFPSSWSRSQLLSSCRTKPDRDYLSHVFRQGFRASQWEKIRTVVGMNL